MGLLPCFVLLRPSSCALFLSHIVLSLLELRYGTLEISPFLLPEINVMRIHNQPFGALCTNRIDLLRQLLFLNIWGSMMEVFKEDPFGLDIGSSASSFQKFLDSQEELFHSQVDQLHSIVVTQCKLTGVNPLSQEMVSFPFSSH